MIDAKKIAALAKLDLTGEELERASRELGAILEFVEQISGVETDDDDARAARDAAVVAPQALRADVPAPSLSPADVFANAPDADRDAQLFRVPRVLGS
jgi:aspartyl-tRNA(Asn)/glutamyl-tRNA(Gln) amidotransferase subunit C